MVKFCQKCADVILAEVRDWVEGELQEGDGSDWSYTTVPEVECEFWAHANLNAVMRWVTTDLSEGLKQVNDTLTRMLKK